MSARSLKNCVPRFGAWTMMIAIMSTIVRTAADSLVRSPRMRNSPPMSSAPMRRYVHSSGATPNPVFVKNVTVPGMSVALLAPV